MEEPSEPSLAELLGSLQLFPSERIDFRQTDTQTTFAKVRLFTAAAAYFNTLAITEFGGRVGPPRGEGLVEQVVAAAFQTYGGVDPHPELFEKAAMLLRGIAQGHPFEDGNKRTGFLLAAYYLELMGYPLPQTLSIDAVVDLCVGVSSGKLRDIDVIAKDLEQLWNPTE